MSINFVAMLAFFGVSSVLTNKPRLLPEYGHLQSFVNCIYKIHPIVLIEYRGDKFLCPQNELNEKRTVFLKKGERSYLYCSGYYNHIALNYWERKTVFDGDENAEFSQNHRWTYKKFGQFYFPKRELDKARCLHPMFAEVKATNEVCANGKGLLLEAGFNVNPFVKLYSTCFDRILHMTPIYTTHELRGTKYLFPEYIGEFSTIPMRRASKEIMKLNNPTSIFYPYMQDELIQNIFSAQQARWYLTLNDEKHRLFIAAPLTPPGDFYYVPVKASTNHYENTIPVFSSIYHGNLYKVEILGRILALQEKYKIINVTSGSFDILKLSDVDGEQKSIYLNVQKDKNGKIQKYRPVPKYVYKIFYSSYLSSGIAFVILNNPFAEFDSKDFPCKNIMNVFTDNIDISSVFNSDPVAGITICCDIKELKVKVNDIPDMILGNEILTFDYNKNRKLVKELQRSREILDVIRPPPRATTYT